MVTRNLCLWTVSFLLNICSKWSWHGQNRKFGLILKWYIVLVKVLQNYHRTPSGFCFYNRWSVYRDHVHVDTCLWFQCWFHSETQLVKHVCFVPSRNQSLLQTSTICPKTFTSFTSLWLQITWTLIQHAVLQKHDVTQFIRLFQKLCPFYGHMFLLSHISINIYSAVSWYVVIDREFCTLYIDAVQLFPNFNVLLLQLITIWCR